MRSILRAFELLYGQAEPGRVAGSVRVDLRYSGSLHPNASDFLAIPLGVEHIGPYVDLGDGGVAAVPEQLGHDGQLGGPSAESL